MSSVNEYYQHHDTAQHSRVSPPSASVRRVRKVNKRVEARLVNYEAELIGCITNPGSPTAVDPRGINKCPAAPAFCQQGRDKSVIVVSPQSRMLR
jgi:hypothetical protein